MNKKFSPIETRIREGQIQAARSSLSKIKPKSLSRSELLIFAEQLRRVGRPFHSLRVLYKFIRSTSDTMRATPAEKVEYASSLIRIGSLHEARQILDVDSLKDSPQAIFYLAFTHISEWNYAKAKHYLEILVQSSEVDEYRRVLANINLAVCEIVLGKNEAALKRLNSLEDVIKEQSYKIAASHCLEVKIQATNSLGLFAESLDCLEELNTLWKNNSISREQFFHKSRGILYLHQKNFTLAREELNKAKALSILNHDFETLRDCDLQLGLAPGGEDFLFRAFFGSSSPYYRQRLLELSGLSLSDLPSRFDWFSKPETISEKSKTFSWDQLVTDGSRELRHGQAMHRLWCALSEDLYLPRGLGHLWTNVYREEHFDPFSSNRRIYANLARLREILSDYDTGIEILSNRQGYALLLTDRSGLERSLEENKVSHGYEGLLEKIYQQFGNVYFSYQSVKEQVGIQQSTFSRIITQPQSKYEILRKRSGRNILYKITPLHSVKKEIA